MYLISRHHIPPEDGDYYINDIVRLEDWTELPSRPASRFWCRFNSFNITSRNPRGPRVFTCLQGAGDILMAQSFRSWIEPDSRFRCYDEYRSLVPRPLETVVRSIHPTDLTCALLRAESFDSYRHYMFHYPLAARSVLLEAIEAGWNVYEWMGLMAGVRLPHHLRSISITPSDPGIQLPPSPVVGLHLWASTPQRSRQDLEELPSLLPAVNFVVLGGRKDRNRPISGPNVLNLAGGLSYAQSSWVISRLSALVCVDSIVLHLAKTTSTPTLALFSWSPPSWAGPYPPTIQCRVNAAKEDVGSWIFRL